MSQFKRVKVFISYSHSDSEQVAGLRHFLAPQVFDVFFDRDRLHPGWQWEPALLQMIFDADVFVLLVGADTLDRDYVNRELDTFFSMKNEAGVRHLIPVLIDGCDRIPERVATYQALDLRGEDAQSRARAIGQAIHGALFIPPSERAQLDRMPVGDPKEGAGDAMQKAWEAGEISLSPQALSQMANLGIVKPNIQCAHREFDPVTMGAKQCESDADVVCPACTTGACEEPYHLFGRFCTVLPQGDMFSPGTKLFFWCGTCHGPVCVRCLGIQDDYPCPPDQVLSHRFHCPACRALIQVAPVLNVDFEGVARECLRWTKAGGPPGTGEG